MKNIFGVIVFWGITNVKVNFKKKKISVNIGALNPLLKDPDLFICI